jgi:beta-lactamase regulating signal transducer with metallopeptidase domain
MDPRTVAHVATLEMQTGSILFLVWVGGAAISLALFVIRSQRAGRFLKSCEPLDAALLLDAATASEPAEFPQDSPKHRIRLLASERLAVPFCWQLHRPYIVLPRYLVDRIGPELRFIIRHEIEHLRTGHPMQLFLQRLVEIAFWYHPMIWWASHRSALVREFACDEAAVKSPSDIVDYLKSLLTVVEHATAVDRDAPSSLTFGGGKSIVAARARRLVRIANESAESRSPRISGLAAMLSLSIAALLATLVWIPVDALASPRSAWSPWPAWTSGVLHDFGVHARDYEAYDSRTRLYELRHDMAGRKGAYRADE